MHIRSSTNPFGDFVGNLQRGRFLAPLSPRGLEIAHEGPLVNMNCTTEGNGDLYGLGVRIGLYLQWAAGFLLRNWNGSWKTISAVRIVNNAICYAIIITMIIGQAEGSALSLDFLLVYYLTIALFYSESYNLLSKSDAAGNKLGYMLRPDFPLLAQNLLCALASIFGVWFWIQGIKQADDTTCPAQAACLGLFPLMDLTWRRFAAAISVITGIIFIIFFVVHLLDLLSGQNKSRVRRVNQIGLTLARTLAFASAASRYTYRMETSSTPKIYRPQLPRPTSFTGMVRLIHWAIINLLGPLIAIVSVERMLQTNQITTEGIATSSGQMISLFTGIGSLFVAVADILRSSWPKQTRNVAEELLEFQIHDRSRLLNANETRLLVRQLLDTEEKRDPAFLEEIIQSQNLSSDTLAIEKHTPKMEDLKSSPELLPLKKGRRFAGVLSHTIREGDEDQFKQLLDLAGPNGRDELGRSPLWWALACQQWDIVNILLERRDLEVNCRDEMGKTALWWAVAGQYPHIVRNLLEKRNIDVNCRDNGNWQTPLGYAAQNGDIVMVKLLLSHKDIETDSRNKYGQTPFLEAAENGHVDILEELSRNGADPNAQDQYGYCALTWAISGQHDSVVEALLSMKDINPNIVDNADQTSLSWASRKGHTAAVKLLLERGRNIDIEHRDRHGRTALCWAAMTGQLEIVKILEQKGADIFSRDKSERTPLIWAAMRGHLEVVNHLCNQAKQSNRSEIDAKDIDSRTSLSWAVRNNHKQIVKVLLDYDSDVKIRDSEGQIPLFIAAGNRNVVICRLLAGRTSRNTHRPRSL